jgi:CRP-like cAMP-binding protein
MIKTQTSETDLGVLARTLRKVDFFSPLTVGQLDSVLPYIALYAFDKGETVFRQGQPGDAFFIVYSGKVAVRVKDGLFSFKRTVAELGPGAFFGEIALVSTSPRTATVSALEATRLFTLVAKDLDFVLKQNPAARAEMERIAARRRFDSAHR